jgi:septin family protein
LRDFEQHDIRAYPAYHSDDREFVTEMEQHIPFSVIGSDKLINVKGKMVRGRTYRWGSVEVENPAYCDFIYLKKLLIR